MSHVMNTYARLPVAFSHGDGSWVTDTDGRIYLDALSGIAVSTLGHNHPDAGCRHCAQAGRMLHTSNLYRMPQQELLADKLTSLAGMDEVFFCNSGARPTKRRSSCRVFTGISRVSRARPSSSWKRLFTAAPWRPFRHREIARRRPVSSRSYRASCGFHTMIWKPSGRLPSITRASSPSCSRSSRARAASISPTSNTSAHCVQLCDDRGWLLICDEVQCGMGRTGNLVWLSTCRVFARTS
jgi:acetylornithine/N-succinyldiaminopimelate aminotransferase